MVEWLYRSHKSIVGCANWKYFLGKINNLEVLLLGFVIVSELRLPNAEKCFDLRTFISR